MVNVTRKSLQSLRIGGEIEVRVLEVRHGVVRLSIDAPASLSIELDDAPEGMSSLPDPTSVPGRAV